MSPLLAPTTGGYLTEAFGWHSVFTVLAGLAILLLVIIKFKLPESHTPDPSISLKPGPIAQGYFEILKTPAFYTYAVSSSVAFSSLFVYLAGSPVIFMQKFAVSPQTYGWIFAIVAAGMIIASQLNVQLLKKFSNQQLFFYSLSGQVIISALFLTGTLLGWIGLQMTVVMMFFFMGCFGITSPNGGALALGPFQKNAGSASALIGFLQMSIGALASTSIGLFNISSMPPIIGIMLTNSILASLILFFGKKKLLN